MPWKIEKRDDEFCVIKQEDGEVEGCQALNIAEKERTMDEQVVESVKPEEKENEVKMYDEVPCLVDAGPTSFADLEAKKAAMESAEMVKELSHYFQMMVRNIMNDQTIEDKGAAIVGLAGEFSERVDEVMVKELKEQDTITKEQHYKEVAHDDEKAVESDFQGGCQTCQFGEPGVMKELANCPFCWNELE